MKIFSLESKTSLVVWSLVLGWLGSIVINFLTIQTFCQQRICTTGDFGFPFRYALDAQTSAVILGGNTLFWILVVFIILSLVRHFRKKT